MREGTIHRDPAYRRFLENIEKPVEVSVPAWVASCFPLSTVALTRALWGLHTEIAERGAAARCGG